MILRGPIRSFLPPVRICNEPLGTLRKYGYATLLLCRGYSWYTRKLSSNCLNEEGLDKRITHARLDSVDIRAPLPQTRHLQRHIHIFLPFGFDNDNPPLREFYQKIRVIVGYVAACVDVIQLEMDRQIVFCERDHIVAAIQKGGEFQFQAAVADDAVENAFPGDDIPLLLGHEGPGMAQFDGIAYLGVAFFPDGKGVDRLFEGKTF